MIAAGSAKGRFFRTARSGGVWRLVTPEGEPFFSVGVCCVDEGTPRDKYAAEGPAYAAFRHYKNGDDWARATQDRLKRWNFNTIGAWSSPLLQKGPMPYTVVLHLGASVAPAVPWGDLFDPAMARRFDEIARPQILPRRDDPHLIGYFTDNEIGWWDDTIFVYFLSQPETNRTRRVLMRLLSDHYRGDFAALRHDWDTDGARTFPAITPKTQLTLRTGGHGMAVVDAFVFAVAERYYRLVHDAIRRYDKNHLILGDRYAQWFVPSVARAAAKYVDVISTNCGADWENGAINHFFLESLHRLTGKPILIGEYYFAAMENRSGNQNTKGGFPTVQTQRERAASFHKNLSAFASLPYVVGAHWFQYFDEPTRGRGDGENYNMGLVDIENRPYEELTQTAAALQAHLPDLRRPAQASPAARAGAVVPVSRAPADPMAGLKAWETGHALIGSLSPTPFGDLYACWNPDYLYFAIHTADYADLSLYAGKRIPTDERMVLKFRVGDDETAREVRFGAGGKAVVTPAASSPNVYCREWQRGTRYTVLIALPASQWGLKALPTGHTLPLRAILASHSRAERTEWNAILRLRNG